MSHARTLALFVLLAALVPAASACKRGRASTTTTAAVSPPTVKDDSHGLLFTWIDDKGNFHVEGRVGDVPMMGRDAVRVVDPTKEDPAESQRVFIADLRQTRADGTYAVRTMSRVDFEAIAVARREKGGPTLGSAGPAPVASGGPAGPASSGSEAARPLVIIYGAEWCSACRDAMRYLRRKGIAYVEKDVEKDPAAAREMQQKLATNGLRAGSIPIIDVRGKVMVGFNPAEIDAAIGAPL